MLKKVLLLSISLGTISNSISMDSIISTIVNRSMAYANRSMTYIYGIGTVVLSNYILKTSISNKYIRYGISSAIGLLTKISSQYILNEISFISAKKGYASLLKTSYILGANINAKDNDGYTPLHLASYAGHLPIVELLVNNGAKVNIKNGKGERPYTWAATQEIKTFLASHGAFTLTIGGVTPFHEASAKGHLSDVTRFVQEGNDINDKDNYGDTPLHYASRYGHLSIVQYLISKGANINAKNNINNTLLRNASMYGHLPIVQYLISNGADINDKNKYGSTLLHIASQNGHLPIVEYLISKGADKDAKTEDGYTPLNDASSVGHLPIVQYLISNGADINAKNNYGNTPLHNASQKGYLSVGEYLISKGADINAKNEWDGNTPLHLASSNGHLSVVEYLVNNGAKVNIKNRRGERPYKWATQEIKTFLASHGAFTITIGGVTPFHFAAGEGNLSDVTRFVQEGNDINDKDNYGKIPLYYASSNGHKDIVEYLVNNGADVNAKNYIGFTPLHIASENGHLPIVEYLISKGADINGKNNVNTPLHWASQKGHLPIVEYLISKGADINAKDNDGKTPLYWASYNNHSHIVEYLITNGANINTKDNNHETTITVLNKNVLSCWKAITIFEKYDDDDKIKLITSAMYGDIDIWRQWWSSPPDKGILKEWLQYALFIGAYNGNTKFFRIILEMLTQDDKKIDLYTIRDNNGDNIIDAALYSLDPEMIREIRSFNETVFKDHLNTNVNKISKRLTNIFLDIYSNLVREINNPRDDTNIDGLIRGIHNLRDNYINICRFLIDNYQLDGNIILKNLEGIINVDTTLTGRLAVHNVKGQDIYDHINSLLN